MSAVASPSSRLVVPIRAPKKWPNELMRIISEGDGDEWASVVSWIRENPKDAHFIGKLFGQTPLHVACLRYPPLAPVNVLLEEAPEAASVQNKDGESPLHIAAYSSSEDVQRAILRVAPETVSQADKDGESPLHVAVRNGATFPLLSEMVQAEPRAISLPNKRGMTPFSLLHRSYAHATSVEDLHDEEFETDWSTAVLFLRASCAGASCQTLLHCAAATPACPRILLKTVAKFYPGMALKYDSDGNTPLLLAASAEVLPDPPSWDEDGIREDIDHSGYDDEGITMEVRGNDHLREESQRDGGEQSVLQIVLRCNHRAASMADSCGRLSIAHAIVSKKTWDGGIRDLIAAEPRALGTRDGITRLYPFQMAAAADLDVTTVYHLVRSLPQHLHAAQKPPRCLTPVKRHPDEEDMFCSEIESRHKKCMRRRLAEAHDENSVPLM